MADLNKDTWKRTCIELEKRRNVYSTFVKKLDKFTDHPENYLEVQNILAENIKLLTKELYDHVKSTEELKPKDALPELIIEGFDDEQVWQELELHNEENCEILIAEVSKIIASKDKLTINAPKEKTRNEIRRENIKLSENEDTSEEEEDDEDKEQSDDELFPSERRKSQKVFSKRAPVKPTVVDDKFFKLQRMEEFLDEVEKDGGDQQKSDEETIDLFDDMESEEGEEEDIDDDEPTGVRYKDFFDAPEDEDYEENNESNDENIIRGVQGSPDHPGNEEDQINNKKVRFAEASSESEDSEHEESSGEDKTKKGVKVGPKSSFETRQERLQQKIEEIHEDALSEKPWQLTGEVSSTGRPQNSLLEEVLHFDLTARPAPVITEETTLKLEDIICQRIKDKAWDDVERKAKPVDEPFEYKKKLILDQEKSKKSLAEIYEQEFLKKQKEVDPENKDEEQEEEEEEPPEHIEIRKMMKSLFHKLDALSNYHYTPKPPAPDVKVITNLPAISVEEVAPVATSDATLLAPEEVKPKLRGELLGVEERTSTDKKRERRKKKKKQHAKRINQEMKDKAVQNNKQEVSRKVSKQTAARHVEKATKEGTISKLDDSKTNRNALKSSTAFFTQLQEEVTSLVRKKSHEMKRKKSKESGFSAKKLKL